MAESLHYNKGNVMTLLDNGQNVVADYRYDPFGNIMRKTATIEQPYMFSTKEYDAQLGWYNYGFRHYTPDTGRWTTRDPLGELGGVNLYGFVGGNAVNWVDPLGLEADRNFFPLWEAWHRTADLIPGYTDIYTVAGHGIISAMYDQNGDALTAAQVAAVILSDPKWKKNPGVPVLLISCSTGKGDNSFAQQLADLLNAPVTGPDKFVWPDLVVASPIGGNPKLGPDTNKRGRWHTYWPRNRNRRY